MASAIVDHLGRPFPSRTDRDVARMRASVDAASTNDENRRHWQAADSLGPNAAYDSVTRMKVRNRGRYETLNNSYCRGLVRSLAYDLIGTCPRLQLTLPGKDGAFSEQSKLIERKFSKWQMTTQYGLKCRLLEKASARCGEGIAILANNPALKTFGSRVKLDLRLIEPEMVETPFELMRRTEVMHGIEVDGYGNKVAYYVLSEHPGELSHDFAAAMGRKYERILAENVIHWYEQDRPGQLRGLAKITSALPLFAQQRRYTLATIMAAEVAAMLAGVMKSNLPPDVADVQKVDAFEMFEMVRGILLTLPQGWDASQFKPEQPTTTYPDFKREILNETGRGVGAPLNVVSGNSSGYNFSSGRLDHVPYHRSMRVDRYDFRLLVNDPVFVRWAEESIVAGEIPADVPPIADWSWEWNYDGFDGIDPNKDANADDTRLRNGTSTFREIFANYGQDYSDQIDELEREVKEFARRGLRHPMMLPPEPVQRTLFDDDDEKPSANGYHHRNGFALNGGRH